MPSSVLPSRRRLLLAGAVLCLGAIGQAGADTLLIKAVQESAASATERPRRGMSMKNVEARYGAPLRREAPVGQPPITRWDYADFSVFFEHQHVVHAVPKRGG